MTMPFDGLGIQIAAPVAAAETIAGWGLLGPLLMGVLMAAVGLIIVCDFRGFATWHRRRADANVPSWLRRLADGREGRRREANDQSARLIEKIVGSAFVVVGGLFAILALAQGISALI
ncbi:hypothetical protein [Streptomyces sp. NPDC056549]|uniref:hypothetical protein n=1 Tax=Streptomyces sp. NPDC056549 TaxID=3345864 RepID=UPI00368B55D2